MQLVRLKFLNEASTKDPEKLQSFLSELYTYLMDEVHKGLAEKVFALEGPKEIPQSPLDCEDLQVFAAEAEVSVNRNSRVRFWLCSSCLGPGEI